MIDYTSLIATKVHAVVEVMTLTLGAKWSRAWEKSGLICLEEGQTEEAYKEKAQALMDQLSTEGEKFIDEEIEKPERANDCLRLLVGQSTVMRIAVPSKYAALEGGDE